MGTPYNRGRTRRCNPDLIDWGKTFTLQSHCPEEKGWEGSKGLGEPEDLPVYSFRIFDGKEGKGDDLHFKSIPCLYLIKKAGDFFLKGGDTLERIARLRSIVAVDYKKAMFILTSVLVAAGIV